MVHRFRFACLAATAILGIFAFAQSSGAEEGQLQLSVTDKETGEPIACRIQLKNAAGKPVKIPGAVNYADHAEFDGKLTLKLPLGGYTFYLERGLEYLDMTGNFRLDHFADDTKPIELRRFCNLAKEGWWSGDLDVERPEKELPLVMRAEDLHVVPLTTFTSTKTQWKGKELPGDPLVKLDDQRYVQLFGGCDLAPGGALGYFNLPKPLDLKTLRQAPESPLDHAEAVRALGGVVVAKSICDWDLPTWVALGHVDAVSVIDRQFGRETMFPAPATQRPLDRQRYTPPLGVGRYAQQVYFHLLNCGLRIPPVAGSGSGATTNPAGYGRTYVNCPSPLSYDDWWQGLRDGKTVITNGPLLRPDVEGFPPGHVFELPAGQTKEIEIALTLSTRDKISYLQIIQDGAVAHDVRLDAFAKAGGKLPKLTFDKSGWFLVRAIADTPKTYRFAMTAPYYVQIGDQSRISKQSAQFFVDWMTERLQKLKLEDAAQQSAAEQTVKQATAVWQSLLEKANAE